MLRCRKCRKGILDPTSLTPAEATDESSTGCNIWHVDIDKLPDWILSSVQLAQWTVGKLNCHNCSARLGGFNFIHRSECPCGQEATVHLNKSRVDCDNKHSFLIVQPRKTRQAKDQAVLLTDGCQDEERRPELNSTEQDSLNVKCAASVPLSSPAGASDSVPDSENTQPFPLTPLHGISQRTRRSEEYVSAIRSSCFCPAGPTEESAAELMKAGTDEPAQSLMLKSQQFHTNGEASVNTATCHLLFSKRTRSPLHQELLQTVEDGDTRAVHQEVSDSAVSLTGSPISNSVAEEEEEVTAEAAEDVLSLSRMSKREKNHMKALRRKQRKRERWLHDQQEKAESANSLLLDSEEQGADSECLTCAICLDVYFSPYSCEPCGHIFCELCLRTIAKNRQADTVCPLCRTHISYTNYHRELDQKAKTLFPNVYRARKEDFQSAMCAKWPLPRCSKRFCCTFWGERRRAAGAARRWHFGHGRFTLAALDFTEMRIWLFDICLVILYIHSVNWILAFLFLFFLVYYFLF